MSLHQKWNDQEALSELALSYYFSKKLSTNLKFHIFQSRNVGGTLKPGER